MTEPGTDFFISYNKADKDWAEWIAWHLEEKDYTTVIQVWDFRPGSNFVLEMHKAIKETKRTIAVLSPNYLAAFYTHPEWGAAFAGDATGEKRKLLPVRVRECKPDGLLGQIVYIDLSGLDEETAIDNLLAGVKSERVKPSEEPAFPGSRVHSVPKPEHFPGIGRLVNIPEPPPNFLPREEELEGIKELVLSEDKKTTGITGASRKVGVQGMGGIGKSVLAAAVARDEEVRQAFPDGVIWITFGQEPKLTQRQSDLAESLGYGTAVFNDVQQGRTRLSELLADKSCLIILDDVWDVEHVEAFNRLGPDCRMLITTRNSEIITGLGAEEYCLDVLGEEEALKLLADWVGQSVEKLPPESHDVVKECGNLPLALALCGALIRDGALWQDLLEALNEADLEFFEHPHGSIMKSLKVSIDALTENEARNYLEMAVFPEDVLIPESTILTMWMHTDGLKKRAARKLITKFKNRALLRITGQPSDQLIGLHDLQYDYLKAIQGNLQNLHENLLEAYLRKCPDGWHTGPDDGYFFQHLAHHLTEAERKDELRDLLFDPLWTQTKLECTDLPALISDYDFLPEDTDSLLVRDALQLSAHVIALDKMQLASQLLGRLMGLPSPHIQAMLNQIVSSRSDPWLHPLFPSFTLPGGPLLRTLSGHNGDIRSIAITSDGKKALSVSWDKTIRIWDLNKFKELNALEGHEEMIRAVALTSDDEIAVSGSMDNTVRVWSLKDAKNLGVLKGHVGGVWAIGIIPDRKLAISGSDDNTLKIWDLKELKELRTLKGHSDGIRAIAITPDGKKAISGSKDITLKIWDLEKFLEIRTLFGHKETIRALAVTHKGTIALSGSNDSTIKVWDLQEYKAITTLEGHKGAVFSIDITSDDKIAISGSDDNTLKVWDLSSYKELKTFKGHANSVYAVAIAPDNLNALSGSRDKTIKIWDLSKNEEMRAQTGHTDYVNAIALISNSKLVISASDDKTLKLWDMQTLKELASLNDHSGAINAVAITPDGKTAVSGSNDNSIKIWDIQKFKVLRTLKDHKASVNAIAIAPDGKTIISGSNDKIIKVWDIDTGKFIDLAGHDSWINTVTITPDGKKIISGSRDGALIIWDLISLKMIRTLKDHTDEVKLVIVTPDGTRAISGSLDGTLRIWDLIEFENIKTIEVYAAAVNAAAITPDGKKVISGSGDGVLKVLDLDKGNIIASFIGEGQPITAIAVTPEGNNILLCEGAGFLHLLKIENFTL